MNKQSLKEELVDLRMHLANAENLALKIKHKLGKGSFNYWRPANRAYRYIKEADDKLCELAKLLGLDKLDVVKPKELSNAK